MLRLITVEGEGAGILKEGIIQEDHIRNIFCLLVSTYTLFFTVIKTQATHDWTVKTSLENLL